MSKNIIKLPLRVNLPSNPKIWLYHDYKNSGKEAFKQGLHNLLKQTEVTDHSYFKKERSVVFWINNVSLKKKI